MTGPYAAQMIEALAREADPGFGNSEEDLPEAICGMPAIERFAAIVRAAALEEAARVCDGLWTRAGNADECAAAIRAIAATKPESGT